jgi:hypothetical protein
MDVKLDVMFQEKVTAAAADFYQKPGPAPAGRRCNPPAIPHQWRYMTDNDYKKKIF